jgi:hypothetical protein
MRPGADGSPPGPSVRDLRRRHPVRLRGGAVARVRKAVEVTPTALDDIRIVVTGAAGFLDRGRTDAPGRRPVGSRCAG